MRHNVELGRRLGVDTRFVGPDEIAAIEPLVNAANLAGGAYEPDGGYIDVTKMVLSWLGAAQAHDADVLAPLAVEEIAVAGGAVTGVATARGEISAPVVVVATGAWARDLLDPLGVRCAGRTAAARPGHAGGGARTPAPCTPSSPTGTPTW